METPVQCGCYLTLPSGREASLPLQSVSAEVHIADVLARVTLIQHFTNTNRTDVPVQVKYVFPVPAGGAVCAFEMRTADGKLVVGKVKEAKQAETEYKEAIARNQTAGLLAKAAPDVFVMSLGAIPPRQAMMTTVTYVTELTDDELLKQVRFSLPTYVGIRYGALPTGVNTLDISKKYARFTVSADIQMTSAIEEVNSSSHNINVVTQESVGKKARCSVALDPGSTVAYLDKDFILSIKASDIDAPRCVAESLANKGSVALSLTLVPRFGVKPIAYQEYIFVIDRSGSMGSDNKMEYAKNALLIMLKSLPSSGTTFNIFSFGSSHSSLWSASQAYSPATLNTAVLHVDSMEANMGGTELESTLTSVLASRSATRPTSVFVLTDGELWNVDSLMSMVRTNAATAGDSASGTYLRVFTLGVGYGASTTLCEGLARAGNGLCLMTTQSEELAGKCSRLLRASRVPPSGNLRNLRVDWNYTGPDPLLQGRDLPAAEHVPEPQEPSAALNLFDASCDPLAAAEDAGFAIDVPLIKGLQQAPSAIPEFYPGSRFIVSAILSKTTRVPSSVILRGETPDGQAVELDVPVRAANFQKAWPPLVHTLAAHRLIQELEDGYLDCLGVTAKVEPDRAKEIARAAIVRVSTEYQLASKYASFIAIEQEDAKGKAAAIEDSDFEVLSEVDYDDFEWIDDVDAMDTTSDAQDKAGSGSALDPHAYIPSHTGYSRAQQAAENEKERLRNTQMPASGTRVSSVSKRKPGLGKGAVARYRKVLPEPPLSTSRGRARAEQESFGDCYIEQEREREREREASPVRDSSSTGFARKTGGRTRATARKSTGGKAPRKAMAQPPATVSALPEDPVAAIARLQLFDGSFQLDDALRQLVFGESLTWDQFVATVPPSIGSHLHGGQIWAAALAMAYLAVKAADKRDVWSGLWEKANEYAVQALQGSTVSFHLLVNDAVSLF
ncbi:hypothetical protein FOMPIDRAFT_1059549 [Fomitopsis schrenkii]|uniref:VIT domain-containing protein n=1 Tax=Fomitopsis schrenkii TaxID=2126942 RepID=S8FUA7_FOMSC|nr:hypothetical protein FOMPIDRAFT_1059549 [Fomitopsis schrenkii]